MQEGASLLFYLSELKFLFKEIKEVPLTIETINNEWAKVVYEIKLQHMRQTQQTKIKYKNEIKELETELRKQYDITHNMKD